MGLSNFEKYFLEIVKEEEQRRNVLNIALFVSLTACLIILIVLVAFLYLRLEVRAKHCVFHYVW